MPSYFKVLKKKINSLHRDDPILLFKLHYYKYLSYFSFHNQKPLNPVFVIGCGRSGTSLLARLLRYHPEIAAFPDEANHLWHPKVYPWYRTMPPIPPFWVDPYKYTQYSIKSRTSIDDSKIRSIFGTFQRLINRPVFLSKSAMITFMIPYIDYLFDNPRYIHIYRDGRAVALSFAKKEQMTINVNSHVFKERGYVYSFDNLLLRSASLWAEHIMEIERLKPKLKDRLIEVSYEDLVNNTSDTLNFIFNFLGVDMSKFKLNPRISLINMNYKVSNELSRDKLLEISSLVGHVLKIKGYKLEVVE